MKRRISLVIVVMFVLSLVSGCANIKDDSTRTRTEGAGAGAAVGALTGALIGQMAGGDTKSTLIGAAVGAAAGGAAGYAYGDHVAKQKEKYATEEEWLDACIAEAKQANTRIIAYNKGLNDQISTLKRETDALKEKYADAETRKAKLKGKKEETDKLHEAAQQELAAAKTLLDEQNTVIADAKKSGKNDHADKLDKEIATLKANIKELEKRTEELASMSASMAV